MSRSTFLTTSSSFEANETPSLPTSNPISDHPHLVRFHHRLMPTISSSTRSNETLPVVLVQTPPSTETANSSPVKSVTQLNPKTKRNLRGKRRSTGIRPDDVSLASALTEAICNEADEEEDKTTTTTTCSQFISITSTEPSESFDHNRSSPAKPIFRVSRVQPTFEDNSRHGFEKLNITRADPFVMAPPPPTLFSSPTPRVFRQEEFIIRRQPSDDESSPLKRRTLEDRVRTLESLIYEKDSTIYDLQRKLDQMTRDFAEAEQQIFTLQRDKLTLIKTLNMLQDPVTPISGGGGDAPTPPVRSNFPNRN